MILKIIFIDSELKFRQMYDMPVDRLMRQAVDVKEHPLFLKTDPSKPNIADLGLTELS